jgi:hypothetical protein
MPYTKLTQSWCKVNASFRLKGTPSRDSENESWRLNLGKTMDQLAEIRRDRLAEYKHSYCRQNAVTETSPCSGDCNGFDELDCATTNGRNE